MFKQGRDSLKDDSTLERPAEDANIEQVKI